MTGWLLGEGEGGDQDGSQVLTSAPQWKVIAKTDKPKNFDIVCGELFTVE